MTWDELRDRIARELWEGRGKPMGTPGLDQERAFLLMTRWRGQPPLVLMDALSKETKEALAKV